MNRILENVKFMVRNPSFITQFIRRGSNVREAMDKFRNKKENKYCKWCGTRKKIQIHHIIPVSVDDTLADREDNFIALCADCHFVVGHGRNYKAFNKNIVEICEKRVLVITRESEEQI
jgi:predicted HNH restriction endonuclease